MDAIDVARTYRAKGIQVVQAYMPGEQDPWKRPRGKWRHFLTQWVTDVELERWRYQWDDKPNMGMICGEISGRSFVVDIDSYKSDQAATWWAAMLAEHNFSARIETPTQRTGGGGTQMIFRAPIGWTPPTGISAIGVDCRGEGGFAMLPPSLHSSGDHYRWLDGLSMDEVEIAVAPQWLCEEIDRLLAVPNEHGNYAASIPGLVNGSGEHVSRDQAGVHFNPVTTRPAGHPSTRLDGVHDDGREAYMTRLIWAAVVGARRECPFIAQGDATALRDKVWSDYLLHTESRLAGSPADLAARLEQEGRGATLFAAKWRYAMAQWDGKVAAAAALDDPRPDRPALIFNPKRNVPPHDPETGEIIEPRAAATDEADLLEGADASRWVDKPVPKIEFVVSEFIPDLCATLLAGDGGSGKSILLQTMTTCVAMGRPFLGRTVVAGPALYITAEDHEDIVHSRQARINAALGLEMEDLAGKLFVMSTTERDFTLFSGRETELARKLEAAIIGRDMRFVGIDSASLTYDDDEINRRAVSAFMRLLNDIARKAKAAVVLICHTSKSSDGTSAKMASGSTAWVNGARSGILLKAEQGGAELVLLKTNHSKPGTRVSLFWTDEGVLLADVPATGTVANIEKGNEERMLLAEITSAWQDPSVAPLSGAPQMKERYLPSFMTRKHGWATRRTGEILARLFDTNKVSTGEVRKNGKRQIGLCPVFT